MTVTDAVERAYAGSAFLRAKLDAAGYRPGDGLDRVIVDPETLTPVQPGTVGEVVVTTLTKQATPLVRYRTRDLSFVYPEPCACGSPHPRIGRLADVPTTRSRSAV